MKTLALFDFDGTITDADTLLKLIRYQRGSFRYYAGILMLSPVLILFKLKLMPNWKAKQIVLQYFFKNSPFQDFKNKCEAFANNMIPKMIRPAALAAIKDHKLKGHRVIVVSASAEDWVKCWCDQLGVECAGTKLEIIDNKLSGKFSGKNCYGEEKVSRIKAIASLEDYDEIYAYGDSSGDTAMLALATKAFYKPFRK